MLLNEIAEMGWVRHKASIAPQWLSQGNRKVSNKPSVSSRLATWISQLKLADIPADARERCAVTIVDTVGLTIAALDTEYGRATRAAFADPGAATVFGLEDGHAPEAAAVINGTCGHGEDFDNTFEGCPVHSGVVIIPALVAAGERYGLSSSNVAKGIAVGIDVMCRLGLVAGKSVHSAGFHPTAIFGTMAAAAGVAAARGLPPKQIEDSLGIAGSMAAGIIEYLADGSSTKRLHAGWAAQSGLRAAALGGAGFSGPITVFEGRTDYSTGLHAALSQTSHRCLKVSANAGRLPISRSNPTPAGP